MNCPHCNVEMPPHKGGNYHPDPSNPDGEMSLEKCELITLRSKLSECQIACGEAAEAIETLKSERAAEVGKRISAESRLDAAEKQLAAHNRRCGYCDHWSVVEKCTMCESEVGGDAGISIEHDLNLRRIELESRLGEILKLAENARPDPLSSTMAEIAALARGDICPSCRGSGGRHAPLCLRDVERRAQICGACYKPAEPDSEYCEEHRPDPMPIAQPSE